VDKPLKSVMRGYLPSRMTSSTFDRY